MSTYKKSLETQYDIIHAYGGNENGEYDENIKEKDPVFARKVIVTGRISGVKGFGRLKLWD